MGTVARQATWNTLLTTVGMGLGFVNMALLFPRLLSPDEFGLPRLMVSIAVVAAQIAHLGENTVIRYFPYFRDKVNGHRGLFGVVLGVATLGGFLAMLVLGLPRSVRALVQRQQWALPALQAIGAAAGIGGSIPLGPAGL
ncbi:MAG: hypothetical protein IPL86_07390 [Flavobacteriales bacterium]|nr:hypothetical protein [Flavobacteriales bacterium]